MKPYPSLPSDKKDMNLLNQECFSILQKWLIFNFFTLCPSSASTNHSGD